MPTVFSVGHGTLPAGEFTALLEDAGVTHLVDVRAHPGSRRNPQYGIDEMRRWIPGAGIGHTWLRGFGGRRKGRPGSIHTALVNPSFRAYADHMEGDEFLTAVTELLDLAGIPVVMCSESVWWRCHRRLIADHLVLLRGVDVTHLMHDGRHTPHVPTPAARRVADRLVYDVAPPD